MLPSWPHSTYSPRRTHISPLKHCPPHMQPHVQVIAIDEAQFFGDLVEFCAAAADDDAKHVIVAGLDGDFQRRRFGQVRAA